MAVAALAATDAATRERAQMVLTGVAERRAAELSAVASACHVGRWTGPVLQPGFEPYAVVMRIRETAGGGYAVMTDYPDLRCSGEGEAIPASTAGGFRFTERIQEPRRTCIDGEFEVRCRADGGLDWRWSRRTGQETAEAVLYRATPD